MWEKYYTNKMYLLLLLSLFVREIIKYADSERVVSYTYLILAFFTLIEQYLHGGKL